MKLQPEHLLDSFPFIMALLGKNNEYKGKEKQNLA
jgi:hypothetical protein